MSFSPPVPLSDSADTRHEPRSSSEGTARLDAPKLARFVLWHSLLLSAPFFWSWPAVFAAAALGWGTMGLGLTVGLHRGLIHRAFSMHKRTERVLVTLGTVCGLGGPIGLSVMHHLRDFFQNRPSCPPYFGYRRGFLEAMGFALLFRFECSTNVDLTGLVPVWPEVMNDRYYRWLDRWAFALQVPIAIGFFVALGWPGIVWGIGARMALTQDGFWFVHYVSHAVKPTLERQPFAIEGAAEEGRNVGWLALLSLGESWHNNHHAYPSSACMGITRGQADVGYGLIRALERMGLAWDVLVASELPLRETARVRAGA
jgi:stearoyl-CoA desaturase (delta-9 desaturase)